MSNGFHIFRPLRISLDGIAYLLLASAVACAPSEYAHENSIGRTSQSINGDVDVDVDTLAGSDRVPTNDSTVIGGDAIGCTTWHVDYHGDDNDGCGTETSPWNTLHHAMAELSAPGEKCGIVKPTCGTIFVRYNSSAYPGRSQKTGGEPVELVTFGDGTSATQNLVIKGELGPGGKRPRILVDSHRTFLEIQHKNWKVENLEIDFNDKGGRAFTVTAVDDVTDGQTTSNEITENIVIKNNRVHRIRGCKDLSHPASKADAVFIGNTHKDIAYDGLIQHVYIVENVFEDLFLSSPGSGCSTAKQYRDDAFGVLIWPRASDILVKDNLMKNISGDGVQCAGSTGGENAANVAGSFDPFNIEVVDNRFTVEDVVGGIEWRRASENAVDIKSCQKVTIARNKAGFLEQTADGATGRGWLGLTGSPNLKGGAFVFHYGAGRVLLEDNRVKDTCALVAVGIDEKTVQNVTIRRNLFVRSTDTCEGENQDAIQIRRASTVDINNNTLVFPRDLVGADYPKPEQDVKGISIGVQNNAEPLASDVDVWNNIIDHAHAWVAHSTNTATIKRRKNLYFDRTSAGPQTNRISKYSLSGTTKSFLGKQSPTAWDNDSLIAEPDYVDTMEYVLKCGSAASNNGHRLDATRAWSTGSWVTTETAPDHMGWKPAVCSGVFIGVWKPIDACHWRTGWLGCLYQPWFLWHLLSFQEHDTIASALDAEQWSVTGTWSGLNGRARGETAGVALAQGPSVLDFDVSSVVQLTSSATLSGVVARATSNTSYYAMRLIRNEGLDVVRVNNGSTTALSSVPRLITSGVDYRLRFLVRGTNPVTIEGWIDDDKVFEVDDASGNRIQVPGLAGLRNGTHTMTEFDDFEMHVPPPIAPTADLTLASDDFGTCGDDESPDGTLWATSGNWYCKSQRLRAESTDGLALMSGVSAFNAKMRARVQPSATSSTMSGVVARATGGSYYAARLDLANQEVVVDRVDELGATRLHGVPYTINSATSYRVELKAIGWNPVRLEVFVDSSSLFVFYDESAGRLHGTTYGLLSGTDNRTQFDDTFLFSQ